MEATVLLLDKSLQPLGPLYSGGSQIPGGLCSVGFLQQQLSCSLNSLKGGYTVEYIGNYYRGR